VGTAAADRVEAYVALDLPAVLVGYGMEDATTHRTTTPRALGARMGSLLRRGGSSGTPTRKGGALARTVSDVMREYAASGTDDGTHLNPVCSISYPQHPELSLNASV
jgi:hypothetical protein